MINEINARATVLSVARSMTWVREIGPNRGQAVEAILRAVHLTPGEPWCGGFIGFVGHAVLGTDWPLPMVGGCATLGEAAHAQGKLRLVPAWGSIFLLWSADLHRFRHTGFCIMPVNGGWLTVEGNTSPDGSPEGTGVFERTRHFEPEDHFIWWWQ